MLLSAPPRSGVVARRRAARGMTVVELTIVLVLASLLAGLATPSIQGWIRGAQLRSLAEGVLGGLRLAQSEALRRDRQVLLVRTSDPACTVDVPSSPTGRHWMVRTVAAFDGDAVDIVRCGALDTAATGITLTGPVALCFNSAGRLAAHPDPGAGGAACVAQATRFDAGGRPGDRALAVVVPLSGTARLCDPQSALSGSAPHGCPTLVPSP